MSRPGVEAGLATRRLTLADLRAPAGEVGIADREAGGATRRIRPGDLRPEVGPVVRPVVPAPRDDGHHGQVFEQVQRDDYADFLSMVAGGIRVNLAAVRVGAEAGGDQVLRAYADQVEKQAALVRSRPGTQSMPTAPPWARGDRTHAAEVHPPGGLRPVDSVRRKALEDAFRRGGDGRSDRLPDPRVGQWFSLLNAGGPSSDPTRGLNCLDSVLALFETYQRGRPRVAGARAFDGYAHGSPDRPVGGEWSGVRRIQRATRSEFQNLCPFVGGAEPGPARAAIDAALRNVANHLHNSGHGSFAFLLTDLEAGGCHAWAAVNQGGTILFLDPQVARLSIEEPLYRHHGYPSGANVVSIDALVVDGRGEPAPLPYHGAGQWTAQALVEGAY